MIVEALAIQLRKGPLALQEPSAIRRISELSERQAREMAGRLTVERWSYDGITRVPPWPVKEINYFIELWRANHG
jgi:hypothetical protein